MQDLYGDRMISLSFEVQRVGGELQLSDETTAYGYFSLSELEALDVIESGFRMR